MVMCDDQKSQVFNLFDNVMMEKLGFSIAPHRENSTEKQ